MAMTNEAMVEKFQCPGCVCGFDTTCGAYDPDKKGGFCKSHVLGAYLTSIGHLALGLPKGFCRPGFNDKGNSTRSRISIRLWTLGTAPRWDRFNVPVWAMIEDGFLYVRTYIPRLNDSYVDVVEGGTLEQVPNAINVGEFVDEID